VAGAATAALGALRAGADSCGNLARLSVSVGISAGAYVVLSADRSPATNDPA
jgi:hypothetical protein